MSSKVQIKLLDKMHNIFIIAEDRMLGEAKNSGKPFLVGHGSVAISVGDPSRGESTTVNCVAYHGTCFTYYLGVMIIRCNDYSVLQQAPLLPQTTLCLLCTTRFL